MGIVEECVLIDGDKLSQVILPMLNVSRKVRGESDPNEIHKRQLYVTSAEFHWHHNMKILCKNYLIAGISIK